MIWAIIILSMGILARLSGSGFGKQWGMSWLPELIFALPFGIAFSWAMNLAFGFGPALWALIVGTGISYAGMQSATWFFLRWKSHDDPNLERSSTLKPIVDFVAKRFGYSLGDEGYAWIASGIKGLIIGLPVGGFVNAALFPLAHEIGSHAEGRVERFGIDPHAIREFLSGCAGGISILLFVNFIKIIS